MRIVTSAAAGRPAAVDRNPSNQTKYANTGAVAPHGSTQRWTYTVPVGKKAVIEQANTSVSRVVAAAPVGIAQDYFQYTPNGGSATIFGVTNLITNGVNDNTTKDITQLGNMLAGDNLAFYSSDSSTGGTVGHIGGAKIFEYDA